MSKQAEPVYQSFLVRCWLKAPAASSEPPAWRFELREVSPESQKRHFSDLEKLQAFVAAKLADIAAGSKQARGKEDGQDGGEL